jgi:DNA-binding transcriptional LysR family regulator
VTLFERKSGKISPTPAAHRYYRYCIEQLRLDDEAANDLRGFVGELTGDLIVGLMPTMNARVLAPALIEFQQRHPNISVKIAEGFSGSLTDDVRRGALDFAIVPRFQGSDGLRLSPFTTISEVLLAGPKSGLPLEGTIRLEDILGLKLVIPSPDNTRSKNIRNYLAAKQLDQCEVIELDTMLGTIDLVARTEWKAILPSLLADGLKEERALSVLSLTGPTLTTELVVVEPARRSHPPTMKAFLDILKVQTVRINGRWQA